MSQSGRVALVTGGTRGIGRAIVEALATTGYRVTATYVSNETAAKEFDREMGLRGHDIRILRGDVRETSEVTRTFESVHDHFGPVEILVNNAGIARDGLLGAMSDDMWADVVETSLSGAFKCTRAAIKDMLPRRWGRIINVTSIAGLHGNAGQANYAAAKAGLIGLTKSAAREYAPRGITVNGVAPGLIDTEMTSAIDDAYVGRVKAQIPVGRLGTSEEVAAVVCFLASDESSYLTGEIIAVDGGLGA